MKSANKFITIPQAILLAFAVTSLAASEKAPNWAYEGATGPQNWGELSADFNLCRQGRNQSPINIQKTIDAELPELVFEYYSSPLRQINNGHTIQQNIEPGSTLKIPSRDGSYELKQFHFHSPSEHTINGKFYPMEVHFVHANAEGALAVVGVMFEEGNENSELSKLWSFMPKNAGDTSEQAIGIEETNLLPPTREYYYYSGSLTTPPCSEGVSWVVLKTPVQASAAQISQFKERMGQATNRPVQAHNARIILN
ncbi:MAG: carbonic anhydrase [Proteobacteria bacterium]|nr:carbonic anhydrase [Pseudomonadota bacterium]